MHKLILVEPKKEHENQAMIYKKEYIDFGEKHINGSSGFIKYDDYDKWLKIIEAQKLLVASNEETPATTYFTIREMDNKIIGTVQLRHHLTEELRKDGGNIGYGICPSERGKGYGTQQLNLVLKQARASGLPEVMISCDKSNKASAKVAKNCGGILTDEGFDEESGEITEIYFISLYK